MLLCSQVLPPVPLPGNMFCKVGSCWAKGASQTWTPGWSEPVERIFFGLMWFKQFSESNKIEHTRYYKMILCMKTHLFHTQVQICGRKCFGIVATPPDRWSKRGKIIILYIVRCVARYIFLEVILRCLLRSGPPQKYFFFCFFIKLTVSRVQILWIFWGFLSLPHVWRSVHLGMPPQVLQFFNCPRTVEF